MTARQAMRHLIARTGYTIVPGAYDTLTARLVEQAGFAAVYLTGGGYSRANGYPDMGLLTLGENVRFIGLTVEAVGIPVIADADTGYGNALNVIRTVREYEKAGVAAFHLEDQVSPKKCGHYDGKEVISTGEMVGKTPMLPATELDSMGFRLGIYPSQTHRAAIRAAQRVLSALKEDGHTIRIEPDLATFQEREDAVGTAAWRALEERYMRAD